MSNKEAMSMEEAIRRAQSAFDAREQVGSGGQPRHAAATPQPRAQVDAARRFKRLSTWGVPAKTATLLAGGAERTYAIERATAFLEERMPMLVLAGPPGTGKTVAAAAVLELADPPLPFKESWGASEHPLFLHSSELQARGLYDNDDQRRAIKRSKAVALDDIGVEYKDKAGIWQCFIDWFVNARYGSLGITVITTNLSAESFQEHYGPRIYDRLREVCIWEDVAGESMRKQS